MKILVKRTLNDYESWKQMVSSGNDVRKEKGSMGAMVFQNAKNSNEVYMIFEWDDQKPFGEYFDMPDVQQALKDTGTTEIIEVADYFELEA